MTTNSNNNQLEPGIYLGVFRKTRNYEFSLPNLASRRQYTSVEDFFTQHGEPKRPLKAPQNPGDQGKTTSFSGWIKIDTSNEGVLNRLKAAPQIYMAACEDPNLKNADDSVRMFKQKAKEVLSLKAETGEPITQDDADLINQYSCVVQEMTVQLLKVDTKSFSAKCRPNKEKTLFYLEKTVRRFTLSQPPTDRLLISFAEEIANSDSKFQVNEELHVIRNNRVTGTSFSIVSKQTEYSEDDTAIMEIIQKIKERNKKLSKKE